MPAVAMTDAGVLYGAPAFHREARARGIRPVFGVEIETAPRTPAASDGAAPGPDLVLLVETAAGWRSLVALVNEAHLHSAVAGRAAVGEAALARHCHGLIALAGGNNGEVSRLCRANRIDEAADSIRRLLDIYGRDRVYIELQNQGLPGQAELIGALRDVGQATGVPTVATNNVHYLKRADAQFHQLLRLLRRSADTPAAPVYSDQFYLRSADEMAALFPDDPGAVERSMDIAERCLPDPWPAPTVAFPHFTPPADFAPTMSEPDRAVAYLRALGPHRLRRRRAAAGLSTEGKEWDAALRRLETETEAVIKAGVAQFILINWEIVRMARRLGIPTGAGRGAAACSLLAWALGLTETDPLRWKLPFERFLNPERPSLPDFGIEVSPARRHELLAAMRARFGEACVAHILTFSGFGSRLARSEAERVLRRIRAVAPGTARWPDPDALAEMFEKLPRNPSSHPSGVVVADRPVGDCVPVALTADGELVTQFESRDLSAFGLVRLDIAASRAAAIVGEAAALAREASPPSAPAKDPAVAALLCRCDVEGVPYLDAPEIRALLREQGAGSAADLAPWLAIHASENRSLLSGYLQRCGLSDPPQDLRDGRLGALLRPTAGMLLYEEQAQAVAERLAGFTPAQSDLLRRATIGRIESLSRRLWSLFLKGCRRRLIADDVIADAWERIGACLRNRVSLARGAQMADSAWRSAWLKAHRPDVFYAAALTAEVGDTERWGRIARDARAAGIRLLPPDINISEVSCRPEEGGVRLGLAVIRGVRYDHAAAWVEERRRNGPYRDLADFARRVGADRLPRHLLAGLARAGAMDGLGPSRSHLIEAVEAARRAAEAERDVRHGQALLFDVAPATPAAEGDESPAARTSPTLWADERDLIGMVISPHPLTEWEWLLRGIGSYLFDPSWADDDGGSGWVAGVPMEGLDEERTRSARAWLFDLLDGAMRVRVAGSVPLGIAVAFRGRLEGDRLAATSPIEPIGAVARRIADVWVTPPRALSAGRVQNEIRRIARRHPGPVPLRLRRPGERGPQQLGRAEAVMPGAALCRELESVVGRGGVAFSIESAE